VDFEPPALSQASKRVLGSGALNSQELLRILEIELESDFFATRAPRAEHTLKAIAKGFVRAGARSLGSLTSLEHERAPLVAHRASNEAPPKLPRSSGTGPGERHGDGFETFEIWHVRTSKCRLPRRHFEDFEVWRSQPQMFNHTVGVG